ncbi:MAG: hypothetical protein HY332_11570 [Chloroflexi bacterium]|nr:hypothetical protein [Chloroflexota bacterium]
MQATTGPSAPSPLAANLLGVIAAMLVLAVITNTSASVPLLSSDRAAFYALVLIGMAVCTMGGIGRAQASLGWTHPITLVGIVLGTLALLLIGMVLTGRTAMLSPLRTVFYGQSPLSRGSPHEWGSLPAMSYARSCPRRSRGGTRTAVRTTGAAPSAPTCSARWAGWRMSRAWPWRG